MSNFRDYAPNPTSVNSSEVEKLKDKIDFLEEYLGIDIDAEMKKNKEALEHRIMLDISNEDCSKCGVDGEVISNNAGYSICLCDDCKKELDNNGTRRFLKNNNLTGVFIIGRGGYR